MTDRIYPDHIYDSVRVQIATELLQKEFARLTPSLADKARQGLNHDIGQWFDGENLNLAPVHDFWNAFDGITRGFKLKNLTPYLTAENVRWERREVPVSDITLSTTIGPLEKLGRAPYSAADVSRKLHEDPELFKEFKANSDHHAEWPLKRDGYPVVLLSRGATTKTLDGNRRVVRAIVYKQDQIDAWSGTLNGVAPTNFWVTTGFLRQLAAAAEFAKSTGNQDTVDAVKKVLAECFAASSIAKTNFELRIANNPGGQYPIAES